MLRVMLDGECVAESSPNLAEALQAASTRAQERGRLILEVLADGQPLPGSSLDEPLSHPQPISELSLTSADPSAFALNILHEAAEAIDQAKDSQSVAADLLEQGDATQAFEKLSTGLQLWDMIHQVVERTLAIAPPTRAEDRESVDQHVVQLRDRLNDLRDSVNTQDWAALSDLIRYDMAELAQAWAVMLRTWAQGLRSIHE